MRRCSGFRPSGKMSGVRKPADLDERQKVDVELSNCMCVAVVGDGEREWRDNVPHLCACLSAPQLGSVVLHGDRHPGRGVAARVRQEELLAPGKSSCDQAAARGDPTHTATRTHSPRQPLLPCTRFALTLTHAQVTAGLVGTLLDFYYGYNFACSGLVQRRLELRREELDKNKLHQARAKPWVWEFFGTGGWGAEGAEGGEKRNGDGSSSERK